MAVITGSQLAGVTMVTVSGDRTQLTLSGVQREVNGATVVCSAIGSTGNVDSDPATITVQCTLIVEAVRVWTVHSYPSHSVVESCIHLCYHWSLQLAAYICIYV